MEKEIKIYHVETQEDYDDLMIKLEEQGYKWISGNKPTNKPEYWSRHKENTTVLLNRFQNYRMTRGVLNYHKRTYPLTTVIKHKAKGVENMEKVVVPQFVADWYVENKPLTIYGLMCDFVTTTNSKNKKITHWKEEIGSGNAQEIIAKMHLFGYEVEEEKKYYWRKKKEYLFSFEDEEESSYLRVHIATGEVSFGYILDYDGYESYLTETLLKRFVREEDFNKLERVEKDDV